MRTQKLKFHVIAGATRQSLFLFHEPFHIQEQLNHFQAKVYVLIKSHVHVQVLYKDMLVHFVKFTPYIILFFGQMKSFLNRCYRVSDVTAFLICTK